MFEPSDIEWLASAEANSLLSNHQTTGPIRQSRDMSREVQSRRRQLIDEQRILRAASRNKVPDPEMWCWTRKLLEQSSDYWCAIESAKDFPTGSKVYDVCCGAGADAIALSRQGCDVTAVDISPIACSLARVNSSLQNVSIQVLECAAEALEPKPDSFIHIDPDRRVSGHRVTSSDRFEPSWEQIQELRQKVCGMSIKVAPGTVSSSLQVKPDTIRFLSRDRSVRQQRWLYGLNRWPSDAVVVSSCFGETWAHETFLSADRDGTEIPLADGVREFVIDYDPAIRAADCSALFAIRLKCSLLDPAGGFFTSNGPVIHPMTRSFRVLDVLPFDIKKLKQYARTAGCGVWELKSRGVSVEFEKLQRELFRQPDGNQRRTILFSPVAKRPRAIIAEPLDSWGSTQVEVGEWNEPS